jgi:hypothetical protein
MGITMRAASTGPAKRGEGDRPMAYSGQVHHDRTKVRTKNVMSWWRLTADIWSILSPTRERWVVPSCCHDDTLRPPVHL